MLELQTSTTPSQKDSHDIKIWTENIHITSKIRLRIHQLFFPETWNSRTNLEEVVDHTVVEIFTTQVSITSGWLDLEDAIFDRQDGDIEGAAAQVEDENVPLSANLQTIIDD